MYVIDGSDSVVPLDLPQPSPGAPLPIVLADDYKVFLAFIIHERDPDEDGTCATVVDPDSQAEPIAIVEFESKRIHMFGSPNDEALAGHPLYERGLRPYSASEVIRE